MLLIALLAAASLANAQSDSEKNAPASDSGSYIDGGKWTYPTLSQVLMTGPNSGANVIIDCGLTKSGRMNDCFLAQSTGPTITPKDKAVGTAYLRYASVDPRSIGGVQTGDRVQFHFNWNDLPHSDLQDAKSIPSETEDQIERYKAAKWKYLISSDKFDGAWLKERVNGSAFVDCKIGPDGKMSSCSIFAEAPPKAGLGEMAAEAFQKYAAVDPATVNGGIRPGDHRTFGINWKDGSAW